MLRQADIDDAQRLSQFTCTGALDGWRKKIEDGLQGALEYVYEGAGREAWVDDIDADLPFRAVAVIRPIYASDPPYGWAVEHFGVQLQWQDQDDRTAQRVLQALFEMMTARTPGAFVHWFVHVDNLKMIHISELFRGERLILDDDPPVDHVSFIAKLND